MGMALLGVEESGGGGKKIRKPYTITKSREIWSDQEHDKFLEALQLFDRDWKKIEAFVGSKTVIQIRSHAQKYFLKVQKNGTREHVPPPRPKKKAAHPYPQKAPKNVSASEGQSVFISASQPQLEYFQLPEPSSMLQNSDEVGSVPMRAMRVCSNGNTESSHTWQPQQKILDRESDGIEVRVKPNFAQVYQFIGSVFDPKTTDHIKQLQKMDPTDLKTVLLLMRNLSVNLSRPEFEEQKVILSSYDPNTQEDGEGLENQADDKMALPFTGEALPQKRLTGLQLE